MLGIPVQPRDKTSDDDAYFSMGGSGLLFSGGKKYQIEDSDGEDWGTVVDRGGGEGEEDRLEEFGVFLDCKERL